jgi:hypothetical protein
MHPCRVIQKVFPQVWRIWYRFESISEVHKFMVCPRIILGFIISKEGKTPNPKKIEAIVKILVLKIP